MLEIFFLIRFARALAKVAQGKGRSVMWAAVGPVFWIGGEVMGFGLSLPLGLDFWPSYILALVMAACGAGVSWLIVSQLPQVEAGYQPLS